MTGLRVSHLTKRYRGNDFDSLHDVSFEVGKGEIVGLVGKNGAGKTTLMKMIAKAQRPSSGSVSYNGADIFGQDRVLEPFGIMIGAIFLPYLSVEDNLSFYLKLHGKSRYEPNIRPTLELVDLWRKRERKPSGFSFGMKQRLALAMCMVDEPEFMILDEPFIGLDPDGVHELIGVLKRWAADRDTTILISSHQLAELEAICTRYLFLDNGRLARQLAGTGNELTVIRLSRPLDDPRDFKGMHPQVAAVSADGTSLSIDTSKGPLNGVLSELTLTCGVAGITVQHNGLDTLFGKEQQ
ncbi:ABC transporter ATP-binding protein [Bifidobacterium sp. ESL0800]|uniref:ABC transporter ATP-binding protein n=1 Tax=Bifidobacterium sp. ESL0800 TaxID=2983236 RepID=UPI0023F6B6F5|nr:ABC transporter ATP-binding protein [Bifidobacterium sp. ESL0800]WEV75749.1 ABC transporter ATP-binding protein [Bifidobacterium sp. ESL0800]